jgi:5'(3')-deoxyribonucleotidase
MIIGVDIDNVSVSTGALWIKYLEARFPLKKPVSKYPYNVSDAFDIPVGVDCFAFWKDPNLYEGLTPTHGSVAALQALSKEGHEIVFVSQSKGWHQKSKYYFVDKWFPFKNGVILTKEKHYANVDVMIDDSVFVLDAMPKRVKTIRFGKEFVQPEALKCHVQANTWSEVYDTILKG